MWSTSVEYASNRKLLVPPHLTVAQAFEVPLLEVECKLCGAPSLDGWSAKNLATKGKSRSDGERELMTEGDEFHQVEAQWSKIT